MYPKGLCKTDARGNLPLHLAVDSNDKDVVNLFLDLHPDGAYVSNDNGELPLHIAANNRWFNVQLLSKLMGKYPDSVRFVNRDGQLPLHIAAAAVGNSFESLRAIFDAFPDACRAKYNMGRSPLHSLIKQHYNHRDDDDERQRAHDCFVLQATLLFLNGSNYSDLFEDL